MTISDRAILESIQRLSRSPDDCVDARKICTDLSLGDDPSESRWRFDLLQNQRYVKIFGMNTGGGFSVRLEPHGKKLLAVSEQENHSPSNLDVTDARLTRTQKNAILTVLQKYNFDPSQFTWDELISEESQAFSGAISVGTTKFRASKISYNSQDGYYFTFGGYTTIRNPGTTRREAIDGHKDNWQKKHEQFETWMLRLRSEIDAPDLWATVGMEKTFAVAASSPDLDNRPFEDDERNRLSEALRQLLAEIRSMRQFDSRQAAIIDFQFKHLEHSVSSMGRKDWVMCLVGTLVTVIVALSLTQTQGSQLLQLAESLLRWIWENGRLLAH